MLKQRRGLTLVEVLVIITIIAMLVAMLLPAVQSVRESSRRTTCLNNIKQVALGLQQFHRANGRLPNGAQNSSWALKNYKRDGSDDDILYQCAYPGSWQFATLPFVEMGNLRNAFNENASIAAAPNKQLIQTVLPGLVCPSDPKAASPIRKMCGGNGFFGKDPSTAANLPSEQMAVWYAPSFGPVPSLRAANYRSCDGCYKDTRISQSTFVNYCCFSRPNPNSSWGQLGRAGSGAGMFMASIMSVSFDSVTDGLSNTMLLCETLPDATNHNGVFGGASSARSNIPINRFPTAADVADNDATGGLCAAFFAWSSPSGRYSTISQFSDYVDDKFSGIMSRHPGGAVVGMSDGGVRFLDEMTDVYLLTALGSRNLGANGVERMDLP